MSPTHGRIVGGVVTTPDLEAALSDYRDTLGLRVVEAGALDPALAASWGCAGNAGARAATLQPASGAHCFIRLVEQPLPQDFAPTRTFGWASYEITVKDVFGWPARLQGSGFEIVGQPRQMPDLPYFVAMQMLGRGKEMIYFNEVFMDTPSSDLPKAVSSIDHIFIVILAVPDRSAAVQWYEERLGLSRGDTMSLEYTMINKAFGLPAGTVSALTMLQNGRLPIVEVDDYPPAATPRGCAPNSLPPGNALVSLAIENLDAVQAPFIAAPMTPPGEMYRNCRTATVRGLGGELIELIEIR